jgi:hypothetical protein
MTTSQLIIFYIFFFIIVAIIGFPRIALRKHPKCSGEEIAKLRPGLRAIQYKYIIPPLICPTILAFLFIFAGSPLKKPAFNEIFLFFPVLFFLGFYDGLFAHITGVFPATTRWNLNLFVYAPQEKYRRMAQLQILLAVLGTLVSIAIFLFYPG